MATTYSIPVYRLSLVREGKLPSEVPQIRSALNARDILADYLDGVDREHFVIIMLNQKNRVLGIHNVSEGSLTASVVHPREVFKAAILANAASIICGHNHPSGEPVPSREDRALTKRLVEAGDLLGISVLDHVIIGDGTRNYFSFADEGTLRAG